MKTNPKDHRREINDEESWRRNHWKRNHREEIVEEASVGHLEGIWEVSGRYLGRIWQTSGRHLEGCRRLQTTKIDALLAKNAKVLLESSFYMLFLKVTSPSTVNYAT